MPKTKTERTSRSQPSQSESHSGGQRNQADHNRDCDYDNDNECCEYDFDLGPDHKDELFASDEEEDGLCCASDSGASGHEDNLDLDLDHLGQAEPEQDESTEDKWVAVMRHALGEDLLDTDDECHHQPDVNANAAEGGASSSGAAGMPAAVPGDGETGEVDAANAAGEAAGDSDADQVEKPARAARLHHDGLAVKDAAGEVLTYIEHKPQANDFFVKCPKHAMCTKTRSLNTNCRNRYQGRCLGYLAAWAIQADEFPNKAEHISAACVPSLESRREARNRLKEEPNSEEFFGLERVKREGEDSEPERCP